MPHPRNHGFVGRGPLLDRIEHALQPRDVASHAVALTQAIHGLGGVGKTQLAIEYVHMRADRYDAVLWVVADPPTRLVTDYADLARTIGLPEASGTTDPNEHIRAVRRWLESPTSGRWLLVFDNVGQPEDIDGFLPTRHSGHVLLTTRRAHWPHAFETVEVNMLEPDESVKLLLTYSGQLDATDARRLAEALGHFPLALAQAAGYLKQSGMSLGSYLALFDERRAELLQAGQPPDFYKLTTFATLDLAMKRIAAPEADDLLGLIGCLAPDRIPRALLERFVSDPIRLANALAALGHYSLVHVDLEGQVVEIHRLVQAVAWDRMSPDQQARQAERAVSLLDSVFRWDRNDVRTWADCKALHAHADQAARWAEQCKVGLGQVGALLDQVGNFHRSQGQASGAMSLFRRAITAYESVHGHDDPRVAGSLAHLGNALSDLADYAEARRCHERARRIFKAAYGPNTPQVAGTLVNLGEVARQQGDYAEARRCQERALRVFEAAYGPNSPVVATTLTNLGRVALEAGDRAEARRCQERALRVFEAAYGPNSPDVATALTNLGNVALVLEDFDEARQCQERALRVFEAAHGPDHPDVARTLTSLGEVARQQGDYAEARRLHERALRIKEAAHGPDHPALAITLVNLGNVAFDQRDFTEARRLMERAVRIEELALGPEHIELAITLGNLGNVAFYQGDLIEARLCHERALRVKELAYGLNHPDVAGTMSNLGLVAQMEGNLAEARRLLEAAIRALERSLGESHPRTQQAYRQLHDLDTAMQRDDLDASPPN